MAVLTRSTSLGSFSRLNNSHCVLMLGWAGADDKSVKKYADLYERRGLDTIRFTSEMKAFSPKGLQAMREMDDIFPLLDQVKNRRYLMHIFSMNGVYSLVTLLHHKKYSDLFTKTDGVIWDSCPVDFGSKLIPYLIGYNQVINNVNKKRLESGSVLDRLEFLAGKTVFLSSAVMEAMRHWMHVSSGGKLAEVSPYFYIRDHSQLPPRHTFFYSTPDELCPAPSIRSFHEYLSGTRKMEVHATCFPDSPHVKHLPFHPEEYNEGIHRILTFVDTIYHPQSKL
ncbi:hypothetical protein PMAYCL1PPCAC_23560 [Pristionchus mayeri]|uniref:Uncharacterized protein n=1 Tax=Pristionchus mayeri TaxID=1317129 RepID=A0AAN5D026_9BILA|nr:hypothetical protein PMAYCL1PPCAC_23560 [Pristionchus mayeri]